MDDSSKTLPSWLKFYAILMLLLQGFSLCIVLYAQALGAKRWSQILEGEPLPWLTERFFQCPSWLLFLPVVVSLIWIVLAFRKTSPSTQLHIFFLISLLGTFLLLVALVSMLLPMMTGTWALSKTH